MQPPVPPPTSLLSDFFSSLKQVEKRLKFDQKSQDDAPPPPSRKESNSLSAEESLSSPLFLHLDETENSSTLQESSEPPHVFLSCSPQFPRKLEFNHPNPTNQVQDQTVDEVQRLIQLLDLQDEKTEVRRDMIDPGVGSNSCHCEGGFYTRIAGLKGPKCGKEVERLNGWIDYFYNGGGEGKRLEPLRLAYLLLGKAAFASEDFEGLEFPSTVEDFLLNDPPT